MTSNLINVAVFVVLIALANALPQKNIKTTVSPTSVKTAYNENNNGRLNTDNKKLSPVDIASKEGESGLIEVQKDDIPEDSEVYVLEEPEDSPVDGEILKTANNIVFRPLFRYRGKQEALRRNYNTRVRRRYFIPRRSYRQTYRYPYYYSHRYY